MNIGLAAQILLSLLPVGLLQTWAAVQEGYWYARSGAFLEGDLLRALRWLRIPGDTLFALGVIAFVVFILGLRLGYSVRGPEPRRLGVEPARAPTPGR
jgi:nitric oxide reductase subunit B